jgi:hypothetical protein
MAQVAAAGRQHRLDDRIADPLLLEPDGIR